MPKEPGKREHVDSEPPSNGADATPFERFEDLAKRLVAVPKREVDEAREASRKAHR